VSVRAQEATDFDKNANGKLEPTELEIYFIHRNSATHRKYDKDRDGKLSPAEVNALQADVARPASADAVAWRDIQSGSEAPAVKDVVAKFPDISPKPVTSFDKLWGMQIRRSLKDVDPFWEEKLSDPADYTKAWSKVSGANFSFERNLRDDTDAWTALGVIARPFVFPGVGSSFFVPSIEFDRFEHHGDPLKERDLLIFRAGFDIGLPGIPQSTNSEGVQVIAGNRLRLNAAHKTTSGFETKIWAGEVEWETSVGPLGKFTPLKGIPLYWNPRAFLRSEFGTRSDHRQGLSEDEKDFFRNGPVVSLQFAPHFNNDWDDRLLASVEYAYLRSAKADSDVRNFVARLEWNLDTRGHLKLAIEFRNGALTLEDRNAKSLKAALGVAF